ncbi:acyl-CoA dehydrogenase [Desulfonema ishimotonii]|uniref:Acyl-CoA dehydrogenase n=1 Tax=Desulfonema ishimotonii TaxID=45657 RepID=A0A401FY51_9BACT|nr:acyl-CoA dehydrogenase family protein [Desulfonema ishimotonii]GBC61863.1 acyl-CoA dehydrogenase [Desulfonema ishimotonii]
MGFNYLDLNKDLTRDQIQLKMSVREFAQKVLRPAARELDELSNPEDVVKKGSLFWDGMRKMRELDYHTAHLPEQIGGMGLSPIELHILFEEIAAASAGFAIALGVDMFPALLAAMTQQPELIEKFTVPYVRDREMKMLGCWAITEPAHGSDMLMPGTPYFEDPKIHGEVLAELQGDEWVISGQKSAWVSDGPVATHAAVYLTIFKGKGMMGKGMTGGGIAIVPLDLPGVSKGKALSKIGQRELPQGEIYFDNVRIPQNYMIAGPEIYTDMLEMTLAMCNGLMGAIFTGVARSAFEEALLYSKGRVQGGVPICQHQLVQDKLFKMFMKVEAARALSRSALNYNLSTQPPSVQYSIAAKVFCTRSAFEIASEAIQIFGGNGLSREYPVEKIFRDARASMIEDGANEVLGLTAAHNLLKKYR